MSLPHMWSKSSLTYWNPFGGDMYCGLYEIFEDEEIIPFSGFSIPANIFMNVVFPNAFAPTTPTTSPSISFPLETVNLKFS